MPSKKSEQSTVCPKCGRQEFYAEFRENNNSYKLMCAHCKDTYVKFIGSTGYQELQRLNRIKPKPTDAPVASHSAVSTIRTECGICKAHNECLADLHNSPYVLIINEGVLQLIDTTENTCLAEFKPDYCPKCGEKL